MKSEQTERIKIWIDQLGKSLYTTVGEIRMHRMTSFENLGFEKVHSLILEQSKAPEWESIKTDDEGEENRFYARYPAEWGRKWEYGWFYGKLSLKSLLENAKSRALLDSADYSSFEGLRLELLPNLAEEMLIEVNGRLVGTKDLKHSGVTLARSARGDEEFEILIEAYAGHGPRLEHAGPAVYGSETVPEPPVHQVKGGSCKLAVFNEAAFKLYNAMRVLWQLYNCIDKKSLRAEKILSALFTASRTADFECPPAQQRESFAAALKSLEPQLNCINGTTAPEFSVFGQSHLDLAWKWTLEETRRKCARTYSNQLELIDEYPDYIFFGCSPFILESMRKDYPELFERVVEKIKSGNIVFDGGMYVESDTNMPTGEALIRQFLYGYEWCEKYLGNHMNMLWLPDCFGFSGQLPQIMKGCGISYFSTQKLFRALEGAETFPYNDFYWEGIDGTRLLTHFHMKNNARFEAEQIYKRWYSDRVQTENYEEMMFPFGYGDGGGGATREMLETTKLVHDLEGLPRCKWEGPVSFMERLEERIEKQAEKSGYGLDGVNVYRGELYLPWHRGTYTGQAALKFANRKTEEALREADLWCAVAVGKELASVEEFLEKLKGLWIRLMFLQFHDVLPGTSIERVNAEALEEFGKINKEAHTLAEDAKSRLCSAPDVMWNPLGHERSINAEGLKLPACGYTHVSKAAMIKDNHKPECRVDEAGNIILKNAVLRAVIDKKGRVLSCKYKGREYLSAAANTLRLYKDINIAYDAWELASYYKNEEVVNAFDEVSVSDFGVSSNGLTAEAYVLIEGSFGASRLVQRISLSDSGKQLEFSTAVDWHETHKLMRVDFPTVINTDHMLAETQYGYVSRPNHRSKPSDRDRFEGCMHKYCGLAGDNMGLLLLNDGKYGCGAEGGVLSISLLKAAKIPDMHADMGEHYFSYALMPYEGSIAEAGAAAAGLNFNAPAALPQAVSTGELSEAESISFFEINGSNVILDWVKLAEDGSGDIIVRLYESMNSFETVELKSTLEYKRAYLCDMLEREQSELAKADGFSLEFKPFEIKTVRLKKH